MKSPEFEPKPNHEVISDSEISAHKVANQVLWPLVENVTGQHWRHDEQDGYGDESSPIPRHYNTRDDKQVVHIHVAHAYVKNAAGIAKSVPRAVISIGEILKIKDISTDGENNSRFGAYVFEYTLLSTNSISRREYPSLGADKTDDSIRPSLKAVNSDAGSTIPTIENEELQRISNAFDLCTNNGQLGLTGPLKSARIFMDSLLKPNSQRT